MRRFTIAIVCLTLSAVAEAQYFRFGTATNPDGVELLIDGKGFVKRTGEQTRRLLPVMGEIHYSRVPEKDWRRELLKMKAGGVTMVSTYVFWIHHNEKSGEWDWSGNKNLRRFVETCKECEMPLVLRVGPFCHGEVYQGGIPVWVYEASKSEGFRMRSADKRWLEMTAELYAHIYEQVRGLLWKDGGPIVGLQLENESRGPWAYLSALKEIAVRTGFDVPVYTRTGWPQMNGKAEFGVLLPLYGDYADGFWDRTLTDMPGEYAKAFEMREAKVIATIATETFTATELNESGEPTADDGRTEDRTYPYFTCELGGGMMTSYHRRINIFDRDALALAVCKVGSGSNMPGYYMYHGGTNPYNPRQNMAEMQASPVTNYNDLPRMSYDFQCPLAEVGQVNESFHYLRIFHQFLADWGEELADTRTEIRNSHLSYRVSDENKAHRFEFYNDYVRMIRPEGRTYWRMYGVDGIDSVTAMPFMKTKKEIVYVTIPGVKAKAYGNRSGRKIRFVSFEEAKRLYKVAGKCVEARHGGVLYDDGGGLCEEWWRTMNGNVVAHCIRPAAGLRQVSMGVQKVAEQPAEKDFEGAAMWVVQPFDEKTKGKADDLFLKVSYKGDVARVFADGKLVADNFWNGKAFYVRMNEIVGKTVTVEILPLGKDYPIYLQKQEREMVENEGVLLSLEEMAVVERVTERR